MYVGHFYNKSVKVPCGSSPAVDLIELKTNLEAFYSDKCKPNQKRGKFMKSL